MDADLRERYGVRLGDVLAGRVTLRQFGALVASLPVDGTALWRAGARTPATTKAAVAPPDDWWTPERDLLALISDHLAILTYKGTEDARLGQNAPKPIPRPSTRPRVKPQAQRVDAQEAMRRLAQIGPASGRGGPQDPEEHGDPDEAADSEPEQPEDESSYR